MKFEVTKSYLLNALTQMNNIATKGIKSEYEMSGRTTINVQNDKLIFMTSNGHIHMTMEMTKDTDPNLSISETGTITVSSQMSRSIVAACGGRRKDIVLSLSSKNDKLTLGEVDSKRSSHVSMPIDSNAHDFKISKVKPDFTHTFKSSVFANGFKRVSKYHFPGTYQIRYKMVCVDFYPEEVRFVAGNGSRFGILVTTPEKKLDVSESGFKTLFPVDQFSILTPMIAESENVEIAFKGNVPVYIKPSNGMEIELRGMPDVEYIGYEVQAFRTGEAKAIVDMSYDDLEAAALTINALRDKEQETEECEFLSFKFEASSGLDLKLKVSDKRYSCELSKPVEFYKVTEDSFNSEYAGSVLMDLLDSATDKGFFRFYCVEESVVMIVESGELEDDNRDSNNVPALKNSSPDKFIMFFSCATND